MEVQQLDILLRLIVAHLLADFVFQTDLIASEKKNGLSSRYFYLHILTVGILTYLLLPGWDNYIGPIAIMLTHGLIDRAKSSIKKDNTWLFIADQALHLLTLIIYWIIITNNTIANTMTNILAIVSKTKSLIIIIAYLTISMPTGILIGYITKRWQDDIENESLKDAGKWIGIIERILVLTFILLQQWASIGFLLAAKSVFRFGDLKDGTQQKKTEYILIGTFLSFTFSIALGIFVHLLLVKIK